MREETKERIIKLLDNGRVSHFGYDDMIGFDESDHLFKYCYYGETYPIQIERVIKAVSEIWNELNEEEQIHFSALMLGSDNER